VKFNKSFLNAIIYLHRVDIYYVIYLSKETRSCCYIEYWIENSYVNQQRNNGDMPIPAKQIFIYLYIYIFIYLYTYIYIYMARNIWWRARNNISTIRCCDLFFFHENNQPGRTWDLIIIIINNNNKTLSLSLSVSLFLFVKRDISYAYKRSWNRFNKNIQYFNSILYVLMLSDFN